MLFGKNTFKLNFVWLKSLELLNKILAIINKIWNEVKTLQ